MLIARIASRWLGVVWVVALIVCAMPVLATAQEAKGTPSVEDARLLRKMGKPDEAMKYVRAILDDTGSPGDVRREAYNELVTILMSKKLEAEAASEAKKALLEYHDLKTNPDHHPAAVEELYQNIRREIFGTLEVNTDPSSCVVRSDGNKLGSTPLRVYMVPGEYDLKVSKDTYEDESVHVVVIADSVVKRDIAMVLQGSAWRWTETRFGFELGPSFVWLKYSGDSSGFEADSRTTFSAGVVVNIPTHDKACFQSGLRYVRYSNRADYGSGYVLNPGQYESSHDYLAVPLLVKYYPSQASRVFLSGGAEFGYLISAKLSEDASGELVDVRDNLQKFNLSLVVGAGYEISVNENHIVVISVQYLSGFFGLGSENKPNYPDYKTRELKLSTGFIF